MANIEYDLDVSGGLMPQVQALIAPPTSEDVSKSKKTGKVGEHPYFKRPGKGHNHDVCDACSEGGDLICCDKCPASFHLTCHDPPLDESDIPTGQWLCHQCKSKNKEKEEAMVSIAVTGQGQTRNKRSNSCGSGCVRVGTGVSKVKRPKYCNPMEVLVKAASMLNPRQFELPHQMSTVSVFPGTDRIVRKAKHNQQQRGGGGPCNSHVPLPAKTCYECRRSCRVGPLLACDYCPLLFHLDCLDPPLTALPAGRWMCPNHVQQFIDSKLVTSVSATERMRLWDRFSGPVDQDAIKTEFFRKVHCKNPPFRMKIKLSTRNMVCIPPMVKHHYRNKVPLLPSLRDVLRLETVLNRGTEYLEYVEDPPVNDTTDKVNGQLADVGLCNGQMPSKEGETSVPNTTEDFANGATVHIKQELKNEQNQVLNGACNGNDSTKLPDVVSGIHSDIERELKQLDERLIKLLAYQRIQHLMSVNDGTTQSLASLISKSVSLYRPRHMPLPSELLTAADIDRISRVFTSPKKAKTRSRSSLRARAMLCPVVSKHFYNVRTSEVDPAFVRHDASFMGFRPTVSARFPSAAAMRYRSLTIGRGSANDVELERFGHCNYTSPKHAVIFYDECTKHYELINYSEYGTCVNNVLYSCDFSDKTNKDKDKEDGVGTASVTGTATGTSTTSTATTTATTTTTSTTNTTTSGFLATVREIVDKKRRVHRAASVSGRREDLRMSAVGADFDSLECCCGSGGAAPAGGAEPLSAGWEGTALLNHGSLLRFGCVTFVFSIVECATV